MKNKISRSQVLVTAYFALMMLLLGCSDALRGVFLPSFRKTFDLSETQSSMIIMMSYIGNLFFLFIGGWFLDKCKKKHFVIVVSLMWMCAMLTYTLTESYAVLLVFMFFSLGASTMLSTSINVITPMAFLSPALLMNIFSFIQCLGITGAQNIGGRFADTIKSWHIINLILFIAACLAFILLMFTDLDSDVRPKSEAPAKSASYLDVIKNPACIYLIIICGAYYISEHGLQNWMVSYCDSYLGLSVKTGSLWLSVFYGLMTVGKIILAPFIHKLGALKVLFISSVFGAIFYISGILLESHGIILIGISGLGFSVLWPMFVYLIEMCYPPEQNGRAVGFITGIATIFDIALNAGFGTVVEHMGYRFSMRILASGIAVFVITLFIFSKKNPQLSKQNGDLS